MKKPLAIGLMSHAILQETIRQLLPTYELHFVLERKGAINTASDLRPSLMLVDIDDETTEWEAIVQGLKSNAATRRIPIVGLGQKTDGDIGGRAVAAGVTGLINWNEASERLADWATRHARVWDEAYYAALDNACQQPLPQLAQEGIHLFNDHEFWEAHEVLEKAWVEAQGQPVGEVYRAILQVGVAYYQIQRGNYKGALKMFLRSVQWLDPLPARCQGINIAQFKQDAANSRAALEALGMEKIHEFDQSTYFKPVPMVE